MNPNTNTAINNESSTNITTFPSLIKTIGPGILFAGAAIGVSHLVQSTRAGADYGWSLLAFVILANFFKYPFFQYGHRYVAVTGETLVDGYKKIGNWAVIVFFLLNFVTAVISTAGVSMVTAGLLGNFMQLFFGLEPKYPDLLSSSVVAGTVILLIAGKYRLLDIVVKMLVVLLSISTVAAFILALIEGPQALDGFVGPEIWSEVGIVFLIGLMGWMPAPIEASVWTSIWTKEKTRLRGTKPRFKDLLTDFHIGYIGTGVLALFFVALGALVMYGTGEVFASSGVGFSTQLIALYTKTLGDWSMPIISIVALVTMISTTLTVIDAYPRSLQECVRHIFAKEDPKNLYYWIWMALVSALALLVIFQYQNQMLALITLATLVAFLSAPVFGYLNFKAVTMPSFPREFQPKPYLKVWSWLGLIFLAGFSLIYLWLLFVN